MRSLTMDDMREAARKRGGECLSGVYKDMSTKYRWRCHLGHEWDATGSVVRNNGRWCPECAGNKGLTLGEMRELAISRGGECLSEAYGGIGAKLRWRCREGHEWLSCPRVVKHGGSWCPTCAGTQRLGLGEMDEMAKKRGGVCLATEYAGSGDPLPWRCHAGHEWMAAPDNVRRGKWCPECWRMRRAAAGENPAVLPLPG